jgi:hypothetical protein
MRDETSSTCGNNGLDRQQVRSTRASSLSKNGGKSTDTALASQSDPKRQGGPCRAIDYAARESVTRFRKRTGCAGFRNGPAR